MFNKFLKNALRKKQKQAKKKYFFLKYQFRADRYFCNEGN